METEVTTTTVIVCDEDSDSSDEYPLSNERHQLPNQTSKGVGTNVKPTTTVTVVMCDENSDSSNQYTLPNGISQPCQPTQVTDALSNALVDHNYVQYPLRNNGGVINQTLRHEINRLIEIGKYSKCLGFQNDKVKNPELEIWRLFSWFVNELNKHDCGVFSVCPRIIGRLTLNQRHMQKFCSDYGLDRQCFLYSSLDLSKVVRSILRNGQGKTTIFIVTSPGGLIYTGVGLVSSVLIITSDIPRKFYHFNPFEANPNKLTPTTPVIQLRENFPKDLSVNDKLIYVNNGSQTTTTDSLERCLIFVSDVIETQNYLDGRVWSRYGIRRMFID